MKKKNLVTLLLLFCVCSCSGETENATAYPFTCTGFFYNNSYHSPLNTSVLLYMYNKDDLNNISTSFQNQINTLHKDFDAYTIYDDNNNLCKLNITYDEPLQVSQNLFTLIEKGIELTKLTKGKMNITMGSTIDLWKDLFDNGFYYNDDPDEEEITASLNSIVSYENIEDYIICNKDDCTITLHSASEGIYKTQLNLGAISKGYALDLTSDLFEDKAAVISAGTSSIHLNGHYPSKKRSYYKINLTEPKYKNGTSSVFASLLIDGGYNISTSGDYEKCFYSNETGELRSHILNPETGYSNSNHAQVCVYSQMDGVNLDALSTALMNTKTKEECAELIAAFEEKYNYAISYALVDRLTPTTYSLTCNQSFRDSMNDYNSEAITSIDIQK